MTAAELRSIREDITLSRSRFAKVAGLTVASLRKMESGDAPIGLQAQFAVRRARFIVECETMLDADRRYRAGLAVMAMPDEDAGRAFGDAMIAIVDARIAQFEKRLEHVRNSRGLLMRADRPAARPKVVRSAQRRTSLPIGAVERAPGRHAASARAV